MPATTIASTSRRSEYCGMGGYGSWSDGHRLVQGCSCPETEPHEYLSGADLQAERCNAAKLYGSVRHDDPPIPIGPHWMILRNFDAKAESCRSSTIMGDAGNHGDIRRNPNAHLTDLRLTWEGNEYRRDDRGVWTMKYERS